MNLYSRATSSLSLGSRRMDDEEAESQVDLTPYLMMDTDMWFGILEFFFSFHGITDESLRYDYLLESLPSSIGQTGSPAYMPYSCLKQAILENKRRCNELYEIHKMSEQQKTALDEKLAGMINGLTPWSKYQAQMEELSKLLINSSINSDEMERTIRVYHVP